MRAPRGYQKSDFPLPHQLEYKFGLGLDGTSKESTYIPIIMNDRGLVNADLVNANPEHGSFSEEPSPYCYKGSIIPKVMFSLTMSMSKGAIETDKVRTIKVNWLPVYTSFLNRLTAEDSKSGNTVAEILELVSEAVGKSVVPIWSTVNMSAAGTVPVHSAATTALMGLTTDATHESTIFDDNIFYDAMQYYTNRNMLKKVIGKMHRVIVNRDRPYRYYSNRFTSPMVKRINDYTFCGVLVWTKKSGDVDQIPLAGDTTDINHVDCKCIVRYNEWNPEFDQTAT